MVDAENIENNASTQHLEAPVNVIYQTAEDGLGDTIKPRLLAAGADCTKVMVIDDSEQPLTMADVRLEEAIVQTRVVGHTKSSLAPEGKAIAFRLDKNNGFEWIGEYDISADELLNGEGKGQKTRKAKEFLLEILADGGMAQKKIEEEAEKLGIKKKTLRNAKMELGIDSVKRGNQWYWMLSE